jgi:hypothetical protein
MARINTSQKRPTLKTHEGGRATRFPKLMELRRSVMACMLWENTFYEEGKDIAKRIHDLVGKVKPHEAAKLAIQARNEYYMRHAPLWLAVGMARHGILDADTLDGVIQRADELAEFLAMYWKDGKCPIANQVKKGLAKAFTKFDAYQLAKYNRDGQVKLRDVLFLVHPKPKNKEQQVVWDKLVDETLEAPDTWEVELSAGKDKKATFERLLAENKLGFFALVRNLRNMRESGVDENLVKEKLIAGSKRNHMLFPFRFIAAAQTNPQWESWIEEAMMNVMRNMKKLPGKTILLIDNSGSMTWGTLSGRSKMSAIDAACGLAVLAREICEDVRIYAFSNSCKIVPDRHGFALADAIKRSVSSGGTYMESALKHIKNQEGKDADRIIIITDMQVHDNVGTVPAKRGYMLNVSAYKNGIGYGKYIHIDGFSEATLKYIAAYEEEFMQ